MTYNLTNEIKSKLTNEQLIIVNKWQAERIERSSIMDRVECGEIDLDQALDLMDIKEYCEHNRSVMTVCSDCYEIENIINPNKGGDE